MLGRLRVRRRRPSLKARGQTSARFCFSRQPASIQQPKRFTSLEPALATSTLVHTVYTLVRVGFSVV